MALAVGATTSTGYTSANSTTTSAIATQTATSIYVLAHWESSSAAPTITDSKGNTYTQVGATRANAGSYNNWCGVWRSENAVGGSGHTVTASKSSGYTSVYVVEIQNGALIRSNASGAGTTPYPTGDVTVGGDAMLLSFFAYQGSTTHSHSVSGWTIEEEITSASFWQGVAAARSVTAGTYNASLAVSAGSPDDGSGFILAIREVGTDWYSDDVAALLHFDGSDGSTTFDDDVGNTWTSVSGADLTTANKKFGTAAGEFDGAGARITTSTSAALTFGSNDFTMEAWIRRDTATDGTVIANWRGVSATFCAYVLHLTAAGNLRFVYGVGGTNADIISTGTVSTGVWTHVAVCRKGTEVTFYINGAKDATVGTLSGALNEFVGEPTSIGCIQTNTGSTLYFDGQIDELRSTNGVARYSESFTPDWVPFTGPASGGVTADAALSWGALSTDADASVLVTADSALSWGSLALDADVINNQWHPGLLAPELWSDDISGYDQRIFPDPGITTWYDRSGSGNDLTEVLATTAPQPGAGLNSRNTIAFDGTEHFQAATALGALRNAPNAWVAAVYKVDPAESGGNEQTLLHVARNGDTGPRFAVQASVAGASGHVGVTAGFTDASSPVLAEADGANYSGAWRIVTGSARFSDDSPVRVRVDGGADTASANGADLGLSASPDTDSSAIRVGSNSAGSAFLTGEIAEIIIGADITVTGDAYDLDATALANMQRLEGYLAHKWGLESQLPASHPYKAAPPTYNPAAVYSDSALRWGAMSTSADAGVLVAADAVLTWGALSADSTAGVLVQANAALAWSPITTVAAAVALVSADADLSWGALASNADASVLVQADADVGWGTLVLSATGIVDAGGGIIADASLTWGALSLTSTASALVSGDAALTWGAIATTATASVEVSGDASLQWGAIAPDAAVSVLVQADASVSWGALTLDATAGRPVALLNATLQWGAIQIASDASALVSADAALSWGALQPAADASILVQGEAALSWGALVLSATAYAGGDPFPPEPRTTVVVDPPARISASSTNDRTVATVDQQRLVVAPSASARITVTYGD